MSTKEIELSLVAITAREERDSLRKENADLKAKLDRLTTDYRNLAETYQHDTADLRQKIDAYHVERQELRSVLLPADCDWEHHPSLVQCAKDLKAKLQTLRGGTA